MTLLPWIVRAAIWALLGTTGPCIAAIGVPGGEGRSVSRSDAGTSLPLPREALAWLSSEGRTSVLEGGVVAVQALLIIVLLLEQRRRRMVERVLQRRLEFETLASELSSRVSVLAPDDTRAIVTRWLQRLADCLGVDRANLLPAPNGHGGHAARAPANSPWISGSAYPATDFPALTEQVGRGELVRFDSLEVLPAALARDRDALRRTGLEALLLVPLRHNGNVLGALALGANTKRTWPNTLVERLHFVAAILARAIVRHDAIAPVAHGAEPATASARPRTERRRFQPDLARFTRIGTLGEFALSLAHELNQPLAAILSNAQAARRFLAEPNPPIDEVRAIIDDIDADDRRAGEVIHGMRELLNHHDVETVVVDLNEIVRSVARLLHGDFLLRRVTLVLDLQVPLPVVRCDRVQIQQVLLNVVLNGFEAMRDTVTVDRRMIIRTRAETDGCCVVSVRDAGSGIPQAELQRVFDQFFSTKPDGLGMGLAIARSIVEGHGGRIWATNNSDVGATFHFALPTAPEKEET